MVRIRARLIPVVAVLALAAPGVFAELPARTLRQIERLDSPLLAEREEAARLLLGDPRQSVGQMAEALLLPDLSAEQRMGLNKIALEVFGRSPRGAMGIQFGGQPGDGNGVIIGQTIATFPAARVLRVNDVLLIADGEEIRTQEDLRTAILSNEPGYEMPLTIRRNGREMDVTITLGSFRDLTKQPLSSALRDAAWRRFLSNRNIPNPGERGPLFVADERALDTTVPAPVNDGAKPPGGVGRDLEPAGAASTGRPDWLAGVGQPGRDQNLDIRDPDARRERILRLIAQEQQQLNFLEDSYRQARIELERSRGDAEDKARIENREQLVLQQLKDSRTKLDRYLRALENLDRGVTVPGRPNRRR